MKTTLLEEEELIIQHIPGKGAWTYHLIIPRTRDLKGKWGDLKVSGTIDGYPFGIKNLMPHKGEDKWMSLNGTIRKAIGKSSGDTVTVTMHLEMAPHTDQQGVLACFRYAYVLSAFENLPVKDRESIMADILTPSTEEVKAKKIVKYIEKFG